MDQHSVRMERARCSLEGLSVGDAFGERFFINPASVQLIIGNRALPAAPWRYTDDTQMALSIVEILAEAGEIDQDRLAISFGKHYDMSRGYGPAMHRLLPLIRSRRHWRAASKTLFGGEGSFGNGSAMRVAPVGAYFADDPQSAATHAARSAEVTLPVLKRPREPLLSPSPRLSPGKRARMLSILPPLTSSIKCCHSFQIVQFAQKRYVLAICVQKSRPNM